MKGVYWRDHLALKSLVQLLVLHKLLISLGIISVFVLIEKIMSVGLLGQIRYGLKLPFHLGKI